MFRRLRVICAVLVLLVSMTSGSIAAEKEDLKQIKRELQAIKANQEQVLQELADLKKEIYKVKIRVSR